MSGDGLIGQVGGALAGTGAPMGVIPGGRGNDFARVLGIPDEPEGAVDVLAAGVHPRDRRRRGQRQALPLHRQLRLRLRRQPDRQRGPLIRGNLVYAYAALRALAAWKPATFTLTLDGERQRVHRLLGRRRQQPRLRRRHVHRPRRRARRRPARRRSRPARSASSASSPTCRRCSRATHVENAEVDGRARGARSRSRPTARSRSTPTASTSPTCRRRSGCCRGALRRDRARMSAAAPTAPAFGPRSRSRGRPARSAAAAGAAAAPRCPAGCCCGMAPDAIARLGAELDRRLDDRQRHQRQDDHRRA